MSKPNYRVNVTFDGERKTFMAHAPELDHCSAEGQSRAEALTRLEEEIDAQLANMLSHGNTPPRSVDEETFSGEVSAKISKGLHREISYQARAEGVEVEHLVAELLSAAMESRKQVRAPRGGNRPPAADHDNIGNRADFRGDGNRGGRGFQRGGNNAMLDDRATFIEYVRGLEQGGHPGHNRHGGGAPHGGPHNNDGRRRRGRGGRGGGPGPGFRGNGPNHDRPFNHQGNGGGNGNGGPRNQPQGVGGNAPGAPSMQGAPDAGGAGDDSGEV
jgi:predicted RNase H-like HicB family nuclease